MQHLSTFLRWSALATLLVACAPKVATTNVTSAEPAPAVEAEAPRAAAPQVTAEASAPSASNTPAGERVCRVVSRTGEGTTELFVEANGSGTLRRIAPSGEISLERLNVERQKGLIVADEPGSSDLVNHAAMVAERNGKHYIRLGDWTERWSACE